MFAALTVALPARNDFGDTQPDGVAGPLGLFFILLLVVATVFLIRNMNARLRRLPDRFPQPAGTDPEAAPDDQPQVIDQASPDKQADADVPTKRSSA